MTAGGAYIIMGKQILRRFSVPGAGAIMHVISVMITWRIIFLFQRMRQNRIRYYAAAAGMSFLMNSISLGPVLSAVIPLIRAVPVIIAFISAVHPIIRDE